MYYLIGWDHKLITYTIYKSKEYKEVLKVLESGDYKVSDSFKDFADVAILSDEFEKK